MGAILNGAPEGIGPVTNTGGTATIAAILGDPANNSLTARLGAIAQQVARTTEKMNIETVASASLFAVTGGPVRVLSLVGQITTVLETKTNNVKLTHTPTDGTAVDLCATLNVTAADVHKVLALDGVKATALVLSTDIGVVIASALHMPIILTAGTIELNCSASSSGVVDWYIEYEPLAAGASVTKPID